MDIDLILGLGLIAAAIVAPILMILHTPRKK